MTILIAPDKYKGSLDAAGVCAAIEEGILSARKVINTIKIPMADGGEGTTDVLMHHHRGKRITLQVNDPLMRRVEASYGWSEEQRIAFIEMSSASGLHLLRDAERNPSLTTTFGTGELIADAISRGAREIVLGIGGSATHDMGTGMASALGYLFYDKSGERIFPTGENLSRIVDFVAPVTSDVQKVRFTVLCDVTNPLYGADGAAYIFAPQKGATSAMVYSLDQGTRHLADVVYQKLGVYLNFPGAGAGGGMGAGASLFLQGNLVSGFDFLKETVSLEKNIVQSDLVITGEGKFDHQSLSGKVAGGIIELCRRHSKPLIVVAGVVEFPAEQIQQLGIRKALSLVSSSVSREEAIKSPAPLITRLVREAILELEN